MQYFFNMKEKNEAMETAMVTSAELSDCFVE